VGFYKLHSTNSEDESSKLINFIYNSLKKTEKSKKHKSHFQATSIAKPKLLVRVINGVPECFTSHSFKKIEYLKDFNKALATLINSDNSCKLIFTFCDNIERNITFIKKIFASEILENSKCYDISMNGITDQNIMSRLKEINALEAVGLDEEFLEDIKNSCNKDLRNALITL